MPEDTLSQRALVYLGLWYLTSLVTLFMNKFILSRGVDAQVLGVVQMTTTCVMGGAKVYWSYRQQLEASGATAEKAGIEKASASSEMYTPLFFRRMALVGFMRCATVILGLISLKFVPVSFTETIKSSAPFFTVLFAWLILNEHTPMLTRVALVPIAGGLALVRGWGVNVCAVCGCRRGVGGVDGVVWCRGEWYVSSNTHANVFTVMPPPPLTGFFVTIKP